MQSKDEIRREIWIYSLLSVAFLVLAGGFAADSWGRYRAPAPIPAVDLAFLDTTPARQSYADLKKAGEDLSDYSCYVCHDKKRPPEITLDETGRIVLPDEHSNLTMAHGSHNRNNLCYNCHNEQNLETLHIRDGKELGWAQSSQLCGSCHGPTFGDWEVGVHGRISGHWDPAAGDRRRLDCVNCHNPHAPRIEGRNPAPGPNLLRPGYSATGH